MTCKKRPEWELCTIGAADCDELAAALANGWEPYAVDPTGHDYYSDAGGCYTSGPLHYLKRPVMCKDVLHAHTTPHVAE